MFTTMNKIEFGTWVRQEREKKNWSQSDLARESGLYRSIINNIETGKSNSAPATLTALANAFGYPPKFLFELVDLLPVEAELSPLKQKLLKISESLPDSDIELALSLLEQRQAFYKKNPNAKPIK